MVQIALLVAVLFVSASAFPFGFLDNLPHAMDTLDDDEVDDGGRRAGVAGQAGMTLSPDGGGSSSDSSSSEEDMATMMPGIPTSAVAGPIKGAGAAGAAGDSSNNNDAVAPAGGPIIKKAMVQNAATGNSGEAQAIASAYFANSLNMKATTADRKRHGRQSGFLVALTVLGLVVGVAAISIGSYRHKEAILARVGWH